MRKQLNKANLRTHPTMKGQTAANIIEKAGTQAGLEPTSIKITGKCLLKIEIH